MLNNRFKICKTHRIVNVGRASSPPITVSLGAHIERDQDRQMETHTQSQRDRDRKTEKQKTDEGMEERWQDHVCSTDLSSQHTQADTQAECQNVAQGRPAGGFH